MDISIHAPPRGATPRNQLPRYNRAYFNSRPSARGDIHRMDKSRNEGYFNSRPSARGDDGAGAEMKYQRISIHAPPRGATSPHKKIFVHLLFQFTPLREGRPDGCGGGGVKKSISIHAPPRGATFPAVENAQHGGISIHAPPRGATCFPNSNIRFPGISIHAPPRGATLQFHHLTRRGNFNSRPSARGDSKRYAISANLLFNPYKSAWLNNRARQFVEIILVIFHRIIA